METDQGVITEQKDIMVHVVQSYQSLFDPVEPRDIFLSINFWESNRKVKEEAKEALIKLFWEKEDKQVVFDIYEEGCCSWS